MSYVLTEGKEYFSIGGDWYFEENGIGIFMEGVTTLDMIEKYYLRDGVVTW